MLIVYRNQFRASPLPPTVLGVRNVGHCRRSRLAASTREVETLKPSVPQRQPPAGGLQLFVAAFELSPHCPSIADGFVLPDVGNDVVDGEGLLYAPPEGIIQGQEFPR